MKGRVVANYLLPHPMSDEEVANRLRVCCRVGSSVEFYIGKKRIGGRRSNLDKKRFYLSTAPFAEIFCERAAEFATLTDKSLMG